MVIVTEQVSSQETDVSPELKTEVVAGIKFHFLQDVDHFWLGGDDGAWQEALRRLVQYSPAKSVCVEYVLPDMDPVFLKAAAMANTQGAQSETPKSRYAQYVQTCAWMGDKDMFVCDPARDWRWAALIVGHATALRFLNKNISANRIEQNRDIKESGINRRQFLFGMMKQIMLGALVVPALSQVAEQTLSLSAKTRVQLPANYQDLRRMVIAFNLLQLKNNYKISEYALTYPPVHREGIFTWLKILDGRIDQTPQHPTSINSLFAVRRWHYDKPTKRWRREIISF